MALAARVSKYGITIEQALWHLPLAVLNQLLIWDELSNGRKPRWVTNADQSALTLDELLADALTSVV